MLKHLLINLAFATTHFVIELFPFDYLSNQKQWKSTKKNAFQQELVLLWAQLFKIYPPLLTFVQPHVVIIPRWAKQAPGSL
jgi:hypothetical protein